ncbi:MAG TPA: actin-binding WH2 domain-containing protein [Candidatus Hydrogenedentes bacterium]|nr:actin-binding WH2 domain-containing protein [Candidatus Hydrogenedentota bacterium]
MSDTPDKNPDSAVPPIPDFAKDGSFRNNVESVSSAEFPRGFWRQVDYALQHPEEISESLRRDDQSWKIVRILFVISLFMAAIYGAIMGATNLLQGSEMPYGAKAGLIAITALKVPVLFLLTLIIVVFPIYVSNAFVGTRLSFGQISGFLMTACTVTTVTLASMATVSLFFALTSTSYHFIKLLHVMMFAYAGATGLTYLQNALRTTARRLGRPAPGGVFVIWLALYMFVGTQLAWVLRPFVGSPGEPFQVFRPRSGNFYESVLQSVGAFLKSID